MIKIFILLLLAGTCNTQLQAQKNIDFIITIDDNVVVGSLSRFRLIASFNSGIEQTIEADYYPGNLSLKQSDYEKLLDTSIKTIFIAFDYSEYCKIKQNVYNYKIDINKGWLKNYYYVLHVYNTTKKKYKNLYTPLKGETYTFESNYPGGSTKRVMKRSKGSCD